jgi:hypothetical protein
MLRCGEPAMDATTLISWVALALDTATAVALCPVTSLLRYILSESDHGSKL